MSELQVLRKIGSGALGIVQEALWQQGCTVALKKLHFLDSDTLAALGIEWASDELRRITDKFLHECQINSQLRHPNIVQFLGVGVTNYDSTRDPHVLVMEYMPGGSLSDLLSCNSSLPLQRQLAILIDVCSGLVYLHSRQPVILHFDIKPDNILFDGAGRAKLGDLGESHITSTIEKYGTIQTLTPHGVGTPLYMAPELREAGERKSGRTDMFSFGVVMCQMSSGQKPAPGPESEKISRYNMRVVLEQDRRADNLRAMRDQCLRELACRLIQHEMSDRLDAKETLAILKQLREDNN
jgi:serine/threonine protein kinase